MKKFNLSSLPGLPRLPRFLDHMRRRTGNKFRQMPEGRLLARSESANLHNRRIPQRNHGATSMETGDSAMSDDSKLKAYQQNSNYERIPQPGIPTYTEAWALIEAARRMATAADFANQEDLADRNKVREAVRLNWRLWTIFQAEMTVDDQEGVSDEIRTNMLTLCKFVDEHTLETMQEPTPEKVSTLIDINRNIAAGLLDSLKRQELESGDGEEPAADAAAEQKNAINIATSA